MLEPVEVCHEGEWIPATLMNTRHDDGQGFGLVGYTHPVTRVGYYRWVHESLLRLPGSTSPRLRLVPGEPSA